MNNEKPEFHFDLSSCPFCGGTAYMEWTQCPQTMDEFDDRMGDNPRRYFVRCEICGARTRMVDGRFPSAYEGEDAVDEWNNHAAITAQNIWNNRAK